MKYIIDEEELKEYAEYCGWSFESMVKVLNLKSKTPVEEVQEITFAIDGGLKNKNLKMYIEVIK